MDVPTYDFLVFAFRTFAQRFFWAADIFFRAAAESLDFARGFLVRPDPELFLATFLRAAIASSRR